MAIDCVICFQVAQFIAPTIHCSPPICRLQKINIIYIMYLLRFSALLIIPKTLYYLTIIIRTDTHCHCLTPARARYVRAHGAYI